MRKTTHKNTFNKIKTFENQISQKSKHRFIIEGKINTSDMGLEQRKYMVN